VSIERRLPEWFKVPMPGGEEFLKLRRLLRQENLHTVCEEAHCPNIGDCWQRLTATFMILGDTCTWRCHYCAVKTGRPELPDSDEPAKLARTVAKLGLRYSVITSVTREDITDGGASVFAECIRQINDLTPYCKVEVLIPDFKGEEISLRLVLEAAPDVLNHNIETVSRVFKKVRPKGDYNRSLELLKRSKEISPKIPTKSGFMVGLGETWDELLGLMDDLRGVGCQLLTIGQYLRPSAIHFPVERYYTPSEFDSLKEEGLKRGFRHVASGPLVRSSYHADEQAAAANLVTISPNG